jgi:phosphatidylserine decarboxylase
MLSGYGKSEWLTILGIGVLLMVASSLMGWWWLVVVFALITLGGLLFFRDPERRTPVQRGVVVSPADGRISSIHEVEHCEPLGEPALCIRVFLSVLDVHVNRSPCHAIVQSVAHKPGDHLNVLNPASAEVNESVTTVLLHPTRRYPIAVVRQVAGLLARTIVCALKPEQILQRGQRIGMIKLGSTTELYLPRGLTPIVEVEKGQYVYGGVTVLAKISAPPLDKNEDRPARGNDDKLFVAEEPATPGDLGDATPPTTNATPET